jgi:hypothetical protein
MPLHSKFRKDSSLSAKISLLPTLAFNTCRNRKALQGSSLIIKYIMMAVAAKLKQLRSNTIAKKTFIGALIFLVVFSGVGFFVVPPILKSVLTKKLSEKLHRPVAIRQIKVNPFVLSVTVRGLLIKERNDRNAFVSFDELYLNFQSISILKKGLILSEIKVNKPYVKIVRNEDGSYNFSDLLESKPLESKPKKEEKNPRFSLNNVQILNGSVDFFDGPKHTTHKLRDMNIKIPFISSLPYYADIYLQPSFEAKVNDTPVSFKGETKPFKDSLETHLDINVKDLDIPFYMAYSPFKTPFKMLSGFLDINTGVSYIQYRDRPPYLNVTGNVAFKKVKIVDLKANPLVSLPASEISFAPSDLIAKKIHLANVMIQSPELKISRDRSAKINLLDFLPEKQPGGKPPAKETTPLSLDADHIQVADGKIEFSDFMPQEPVNLIAEKMNFKGTNFSTAKDSKGEASLSLVFNKKGSVTTSGSVGINPPSANMKLNVRGIEIAPFQSYFTDLVKIIITRGDMSLKGIFSAGYAEDGIMKASYKGEAFVKNFTSLDKANAEEFLKWNSLYFGGMDATYNPFYVNIAQVALTDFYSLIIINKDGSINLQGVMQEKGSDKATAEQQEAGEPIVEAYAEPVEAGSKEIPGGELQKPSEAAQEKPADIASKSLAAAPTQKPEKLIKIKTVTLQGGTINFSDRHIEPNYSSNFLEIGGRVSGLSSEENKFANVELRGKLENYAPLEITGKINPLRDDLYVDLKIDFKNMDMSPLTPYSGRYLGYTIQKGALSLNLQYLIVKKKLDSQNNIFLDQFTLGDRVESSKSTKLPVRLAIALLKNRKGEIDLNIPVSGNINDPKFSIGRIIIKMLLNLLAKAATSPFALIGAIFGGGEELSYVEFDYGSHDLAEQDAKKLNTLVKALFDRPALKLEIEGHVDVEKDREGLKQYLFRKKINAQKLKDLVKKGQPAVPVDKITIEKEEYAKYLKMAYKEEKFPKPRTILGFAKDLPVPEMEKLMLTHIEIKDDDFRQLVSQRALKVKDYILNSGQVTADRMFLVEPKSLEPEKKEKLKNSRVDFRLK